ncbi:MAG: IS1634 family transposase, partial [Verrucomicrobia bacterium]|nr:IS1634 family transposase [Verrucomicrobiota bacterium]
MKSFLEKIAARYGQARRVWLMGRGIPTEAVLEQMRASDPPVSYLVGTPKGALSALEKALLDRPWEAVRTGVQVKLLPQDEEVYVLAQSAGRVDKERAIRRKKLRRLLARLHELRRQLPERDQLLMALGAAKKEAGRFYALLQITVPAPDQAVTATTFQFRWHRARLRVVRRREGRYLLRSNLTGRKPAELWTCYMQLVQVEEAFKNLKGDLGLRPVFHQKMARIEAHILVAFIAYTLHVCLRQRLRAVAGGLTPRAVLEKFCAVQMVDVHLPTTDGREVILTRHTQPERELQVLLEQLKLTLPAQLRIASCRCTRFAR